jgi:hypothetical protein
LTEPQIEQETTCVGCGYNLFGLSQDGQCPECGMAKADSIRGDKLAFANQAWLAGVCRGLTLLYVACLTTLASFAVVLIGLIVLALAPGVPLWMSMLSAILRIAAVGVPILAMVGVFLATVPDPAESLRESPTSHRRVARMTAVAMVASVLLRFGIERLVIAQNFSAKSGETCIIAAEILGRVLVLAMILTLFTYLATLARRIPNPSMADSGVSTARKFVVFSLLLYLLKNASPPGGVTQFEGLDRLIPLLRIISRIVLFILAIKLMLLIGTYRRAFVACREQGRQ